MSTISEVSSIGGVKDYFVDTRLIIGYIYSDITVPAFNIINDILNKLIFIPLYRISQTFIEFRKRIHHI